MKNWFRHWLGIENDKAEILRRLAASVRALEARESAADQAFIQCSAEIEKLRQQLEERSQQPAPTVRRAPSFSAFRSAAEAHSVHQRQASHE